MSHNQAALLLSKQGPIEVKETEKWTAGPGEILIRNNFAASNPVDYKIKKYGLFVENFPFVLGGDVSGTVEAVGEGVTRFAIGDKVWSWLPYLFQHQPKYGAFQRFSVADADLTGKIPSNVSSEEAATIPLSVITVGVGLYSDLKIPLPTTAKRPSPSADAPFFYVHGGSSSTGIVAIQFALLSGFRVVSTASPKNFDLVKSYGAEAVFDYRDSQLVEKIKQHTGGKRITKALDAISENGSVELSVKVLEDEGELAITLPPPSGLKSNTKIYPIGSFLIGKPENAHVKRWIAQFTSEALQNRSLLPVKPEIVANGLSETQKLLDFHASGQVSGFKPLIRID